MSGLYASLANGVKALNAQSRAVEVAGNNLANVNNPNYARQRVVFGERGTVVTPQGAQSLGVEAIQLKQLRDSFADEQVVSEIATTARYEAQQSTLQQAQVALGQTIDRSVTATNAASGTGAGLNEALASFFDSFGSFAVNPNDTAERQVLLQKATVLTDKLNSVDDRLVALQTNIDDQIDVDVEDANRIISVIADLNAQIGRLEINVPGSAVDLRDQRQAKLEELAEIIPVESSPSSGSEGQIDVVTRDASGNEILLVSRAVTYGSVAFDGTDVTAGTPATVIGGNRGSIMGSLETRDGAIQSLRDSLDTISEQLVTAVNDAYNPTGATGNFFAAGGLSAGTIALDSTVTVANLKASDGGAAGDNSIALAVNNIALTSFSTAAGDALNGTLAQYYAGAVSALGQSITSVDNSLTDQTSIEDLVRRQRDAVSGVSLDEEMSDLLKYQRSFQAASRVIQVIDELLETIVTRLGA